MYLNPKDSIPNWFKSVMYRLAAFRFFIRVSHKQIDKRGLCLAKMASTLENLGLYQCHLQFAHWMKLQEAASSNRDISLLSGWNPQSMSMTCPTTLRYQHHQTIKRASTHQTNNPSLGTYLKSPGIIGTTIRLGHIKESIKAILIEFCKRFKHVVWLNMHPSRPWDSLERTREMKNIS